MSYSRRLPGRVLAITLLIMISIAACRSTGPAPSSLSSGLTTAGGQPPQSPSLKDSSPLPVTAGPGHLDRVDLDLCDPSWEAVLGRSVCGYPPICLSNTNHRCLRWDDLGGLLQLLAPRRPVLHGSGTSNDPGPPVRPLPSADR